MNWSALGTALTSVVNAVSDTEVTFTRLTQSWADDDDSSNTVTSKAIIEYEFKEGNAVSRRASLIVPLMSSFEPSETDQLSFNGDTWKIVGIVPMGMGQAIGYEVKAVR